VTNGESYDIIIDTSIPALLLQQMELDRHLAPNCLSMIWHNLCWSGTKQLNHC